jgi:hypothetical protein
MKKLSVFILIAAIATPGSYAFAGASNPMSQSYNARNVSRTATGREDARKAARPARPPVATQQRR